ncbi:MAG: protein kinase [Candidatus Sericytochromatia bacterium]|nr:protein kinase [Candidatus Sericytochromatia bacterium]
MKSTGLICNKCGFKNLIGEKYCSECGNYLLARPQKASNDKPPVKAATIKCPNCSFDSEADKKFCSQCGFPLRVDTKIIGENTSNFFEDDFNIDSEDLELTKPEPVVVIKKTANGLLTPGTLLQSRYKITKLIGQGGMGAIYLADDTRFSNRVCVAKEMLDHFTDEEQRNIATSNFLREADMLSSMHHDGIPEVYDRFSEGNRHYLVMEYIQGTDLEQKSEQDDEPFDEKSVLNWSIQICDILSYLHNQKPPIIYRDMKPANLILTKTGKIYMVDFGIARFFNPIRKGTMVGTQGYAPPEQYRGLMEPRSDIFALGATMHHLLTGRDPQDEPPFSFPKVRTLNNKISVSTEKLIEKALEKDVGDRFDSAEDMLKSIMKITSNYLDGVKICPHCNNKVGATKQFCPHCNEYISSISTNDLNKRSFRKFILSTKFLVGSNVTFVLLNIVLIIILLLKK